MWKTRCNHRHRRDKGQASISEQVAIQRELEELYKLEDKVLPCDTQAFTIPLSEHKERAPWKIKRWILRWKEVLKQSTVVAEETAAAGTKKIYSYFLDAQQSYFVRKPKTKFRRPRRKRTVRHTKVVPITSKFQRVATKSSTSRAPVADTRKIPSQLTLAAFFPRDRFPDHPS